MREAFDTIIELFAMVGFLMLTGLAIVAIESGNFGQGILFGAASILALLIIIVVEKDIKERK